jgi:hypothetical protein
MLQSSSLLFLVPVKPMNITLRGGCPYRLFAEFTIRAEVVVFYL